MVLLPYSDSGIQLFFGTDWSDAGVCYQLYCSIKSFSTNLGNNIKRKKKKNILCRTLPNCESLGTVWQQLVNGFAHTITVVIYKPVVSSSHHRTRAQVVVSIHWYHVLKHRTQPRGTESYPGKYKKRWRSKLRRSGARQHHRRVCVRSQTITSTLFLFHVKTALDPSCTHFFFFFVWKVSRFCFTENISSSVSAGRNQK